MEWKERLSSVQDTWKGRKGTLSRNMECWKRTDGRTSPRFYWVSPSSLMFSNFPDKEGDESVVFHIDISDSVKIKFLRNEGTEKRPPSFMKR